MKYLFVVAFIVIFISFDKSIGYTETSPLYTHFTYMFQHTGILHLVINSIAFIGMFRSLEKCVNKWTLSVSIILTAFVTSFFSMYEIPTVGASSMIYAAIGIFIALSSISDKIKIVDRRKYALFILAVILSLTVSGFKPNSNFWLHAYSLLFGIPIGGIIWLYNGR